MPIIFRMSRMADLNSELDHFVTKFRLFETYLAERYFAVLQKLVFPSRQVRKVDNYNSMKIAKIVKI